MSYFRKILISAVSGSLVIFAGVLEARAQSAEEILFKIGSVKPVKAGADVVSCNFEVTFYNRTPSDIKNAAVDVTWVDQAVKAMDEEEKSGPMNPEAFIKMLSASTDAAAPARRSNVRPVRTGAVSPGSIRKSISLPSLKAYEQTVVSASLESDRCFLLMDDLEFSVRGCQKVVAGSSSGGNAAICNDMFRFVSPRDEQYYREFKKMSVEEQRAEDASRHEKLKQEIGLEYNAVVNKFEEASRILTSIK